MGRLFQRNSVISQFFGSFRVAVFFADMGLTIQYKKGLLSYLGKKYKDLWFLILFLP